MGVITSLTRMWLTRSINPFVFTDEFDRQFSFEDCSNLGLYVHIPFCERICNFCPYCKMLYDEELCGRYVDALIREIHMVGAQVSEKKVVTSLYFGGGSPALVADRMKEIIEAISQHYIITEGIGVELHPNNMKVSLLRTLKDAGVTKISIGIQSFQKKYQTILGREAIDIHVISDALQVVPFETVSMDLIFALPKQSADDLKLDIDIALKNGANHIAIYPFIDFTFTSSHIQTMPKKRKRQLLDAITKYCVDIGLHRTSIWTFANENSTGYSSMTRDTFLGFGCSATTLLRKQFKINTFSVEEYCRRIDQNQLPTSLTLRFSLRQRMVYYLFWTTYSTKICADDFEHFFGVSLKKMYGMELNIARWLGFITEQNGIYNMTIKGAFYYHYFENFYTLSYIDKMWGIMRTEAFPQRIEL